MLRAQHQLLRFILISALIVAGVPAHAGGHTASQADLDITTQNPAWPTDSDCPFHTDSAGNPELGAHASETEQPSEDCCGSDCRCSCAGLTLMLIRSLTAPVVTSPSERTPGLATTRPSHLPSAPLRPPQV